MKELEDLKVVLDNLNSVLFELGNKVAAVDKAKSEYITLRMKQEELTAELKAKTEELNERESKIANVESIVEFAEKAKKTMAEAKVLLKNAEERQAELEKGLKKLAEDKEKTNKELADGQEANKKQANALIKERKEFEDRIKAYKAMAAAVK